MKRPFVGIAFALLLALPASAIASARPPEAPAAFEGSPAWAKLDLRARQAWSDAMAKGVRTTSFECLMKTSAPISGDERALLESAGFSIHTVIGVILTGSVRALALPAVASLDFVRAMELAAPMSIKKKK